MDMDKKQKYLYIMEHVAENGYDTTNFNTFTQERGHIKVEQMTFQQVVDVVFEYKKYKKLANQLSEFEDLSEFSKETGSLPQPFQR